MIIQNKHITLHGKEFELRSALPQDAAKVLEHRKKAAAETYFLSRYPEEIGDETDAIQKGLELIRESPDTFYVTAFYNNHVVGELGVLHAGGMRMKEYHRAYLGIGIQKDYCNLGLGSEMLSYALQYAKQNGFEQIELGVFSDNERAIHLYEKKGFQKYGRYPRAYKLKDGSYRDEVIMVKMLKD